jgi:hypothetical protein
MLSKEENISSAVSIPSILYLKDNCSSKKDDSSFALFFKECLLSQINYYDEKFQILNNESLITASYLFPRFKRLLKKHSQTNSSFKEMKNIAERFIKNLFKEKLNNQTIFSQNQSQQLTQSNKVVAPKLKSKVKKFDESSSDDDNETLDEKNLKKEFKNYDNEPKNKDEDSLLFWKNKGSKERYHILSEVVKMIGSIQATSTPSERLFSCANYQVWDRRNRISPDKLEKIMFLYENNNVMKRNYKNEDI